MTSVLNMNTSDLPDDLQALCETGQRWLMEMRYLDAERALEHAERRALDARDFDTLSRLYLPLQETRRQIRQRCGEGIVRLDLLASGPDDTPDPEALIDRYPHGQLLIAGWGSVAPAVRFRALARERKLYVETFLAAVYPVNGSGRVVVIVPTPDVALPDVVDRGVDDLIRRVPAHALVLANTELPSGERQGTTQTFAETMAMWERLHLPHLSAADATSDPVRRIDAYRRTINVDNACELAHQKLSSVARELGRQQREFNRSV